LNLNHSVQEEKDFIENGEEKQQFGNREGKKKLKPVQSNAICTMENQIANILHC